MKQKRLSNKEFSIGEIFSNSWKLFTENFQLILITTLIVYIPINIILSFIPVGALMEQLGVAQGFKTYLRIVQLLEVFIGVIATMAISFAIKSKLDRKSIDFKTALKKSLSRWPAAIGTSILLAIFLIGLILLLVIPGIIYYNYWTFMIYAVIIYGKSGKKALDYSKSVVKGRWWKVFWYSLVFGTLSFIAGIILAIPSWFLPNNFIVDTIFYTFIDVALSYFTVVGVVFFINFDETKKQKITGISGLEFRINSAVLYG